jgi:tRNA A37 threonylcarbamoyladenosine modification protein TsaB
MKVLILETSTEHGCVVFKDKMQRLPGGPELSKMLASVVKEILENETADLVAVGNGPGSFTGVRVGAALGKALAYGWQVPYIEFCSMNGFSDTLPVLIDARSGGLYLLVPGEEPKTIQIDDPILKTFPVIASPHPEQIQKRTCLSAQWVETIPDADLLKKTVQTVKMKSII